MHRGQIQFKGRKKKNFQNSSCSHPEYPDHGSGVWGMFKKNSKKRKPTKRAVPPRKRGKVTRAEKENLPKQPILTGPEFRGGGETQLSAQAAGRQGKPGSAGAGPAAGAARPPPRPALGRRGCPPGAGCPLPAAVYGLSPAGGGRRAPPAAAVLRAAAQRPMSRRRPAPTPRPPARPQGGREGRPPRRRL